MLTPWRDILLSFCPAAVRRDLRPESTLRTLHAASWGGLAQFVLAALALVVRFKGYFVQRAQQLTPHMAGSTEVFQAGVAVIVTFEFLIHPVSLLYLYLALEGLVRFIGGVFASEVVPSLLVSLAFMTAKSVSRFPKNRDAVPVADMLEKLPNARLKISSGGRKPGWNMSITIGVAGQWFEVEREQTGTSPRAFIYILRPAPPGKILRGYEEYDASAAISPGLESHSPAGGASDSVSRK